MANITYRELAERISKMPEDQTATVYDAVTDEFYAVDYLFVTEEDDVLDKDHLVMVISR